MTAIAEEAFFKLSPSARGAHNGVLLYGTDENLVAAAHRRIASLWKGDDEPLHLTGAALRSDPALLEEAFRGMSLFGGRRLIIVEGIEESHASLLNPVLGSSALGNYVVLAAGSLNKSSALRGAAESSRLFHCISFYEESDTELSARASRVLQSRGLTAEDGVADRLAELSGGDRSVLEGEAEKLALYLMASDRISMADVEALSGNASAFDAAQLVEFMVSGDLVATESMLSAARDGDETGQMLNAMKWHVDRMAMVRLAFEEANNWEQAFAKPKPAVHFKLKDRWRGILSRVSAQQMEQLQRRLHDAVLATRRQASIAEAMAERFVLGAARELRGTQR